MTDKKIPYFFLCSVIPAQPAGVRQEKPRRRDPPTQGKKNPYQRRNAHRTKTFPGSNYELLHIAWRHGLHIKPRSYKEIFI